MDVGVEILVVTYRWICSVCEFVYMVVNAYWQQADCNEEGFGCVSYWCHGLVKVGGVMKGVVSSGDVVIFPYLQGLLPFQRVVRVVVADKGRRDRRGGGRATCLCRLFFRVVRSLGVRVRSPCVVQFRFATWVMVHFAVGDGYYCVLCVRLGADTKGEGFLTPVNQGSMHR